MISNLKIFLKIVVWAIIWMIAFASLDEMVHPPAYDPGDKPCGVGKHWRWTGGSIGPIDLVCTADMDAAPQP